MAKLAQEFFWTPSELCEWVSAICREHGLWLVVWCVGRSAEVTSPDTLGPSLFEGSDDSVQLFLGDPSLCSSPQWRCVGERRELDFPQSYAVQLVPSLVAPDGKTLLQGRLAIMPARDYDDRPRYSELEKLFKRLRTDLKRHADADHVVVQPLPDGTRKRWTDMLLSRAVILSTATLKQFSRGEVKFEIERIVE